MSRAAKGTWVEIERVVFPAQQRLTNIPEETRRTPMTMRLCGFLQEDAMEIGCIVTVETVLGNQWQGVLTRIEPTPTHRFGPPVRELLHIAPALRQALRQEVDPK